MKFAVATELTLLLVTVQLAITMTAKMKYALAVISNAKPVMTKDVSVAQETELVPLNVIVT